MLITKESEQIRIVKPAAEDLYWSNDEIEYEYLGFLLSKKTDLIYGWAKSCDRFSRYDIKIPSYRPTGPRGDWYVEFISRTQVEKAGELLIKIAIGDNRSWCHDTYPMTRENWRKLENNEQLAIDEYNSKSYERFVQYERDEAWRNKTEQKYSFAKAVERDHSSENRVYGKKEYYYDQRERERG